MDAGHIFFICNIPENEIPLSPALTGYDGILGYRTDGDYKTREDLTDDQVAWLDAHPDFDWDKKRLPHFLHS